MAYTVYIIIDGSSTTLGTLTGNARSVQTFQVNKAAKEFSIRIASSTEEEYINVHEISADVDMRKEEQ
jgi:hypothetical protein